MPSKKSSPREDKLKDLKTKEVYYYIDDDKGLKVKSKEIYKNGKKFVHYPFRFDGSPKYGNCKQITYIGLTEDLPRGFYKKWTKGYGFTRVLNNLIYALLLNSSIQEIVIQKNVVNKLEENKLYLNPLILDKHYPTLDSLLKQQREEMGVLTNKILTDILPDNYKKSGKKYIPDSLFNYIKRNVGKDAVLSDEDIKSIAELMSFVPQESVIANGTNILKTKNKLEEYFIEEVIIQFDKLLMQKNVSKTLEKRWQEFFKKYNWIFSQLFSFPVLIFEDEAYVGGKSIQNRGGKFADFIYKNKLTNNIVFIEIKTHKTKILDSRSYRGEDVFPMSNDLSGALNQVLDQRENMQHEFYALKQKTKGTFESYNPRCLIIIGSIISMTDDQKKSFELIRSNSKDVDIITFDEALEKIKGLQTIMEGYKNSR
jgi:hypothetical protein